jgi:hypothetical protein
MKRFGRLPNHGKIRAEQLRIGKDKADLHRLYTLSKPLKAANAVGGSLPLHDLTAKEYKEIYGTGGCRKELTGGWVS